MFWDIAMAEAWSTSPWDVRENATVLDMARYRLWTNAKAGGEKMDAIMQKLKAKQQRGH